MISRINPSNGSQPLPAALKNVVYSDYSVRLAANETGHTCIKYTFNDFWHNDTPYGQKGYSIFNLPGAGIITNTGMPMLPREGIFVALPSNAEFESVEVTTARQTTLNGTYDILPAPHPVLEGEPMEFIPHAEVYGSDGEYPTSPVEYVDTKTVMGVSCAHILLCPMKYAPKSKKITVLWEIELRVNYKYTDGNGVQAITNRSLAPMLLGYTDTCSDPPASPRILIVTNKTINCTDDQHADTPMDHYILVKQKRYTVYVKLLEDIVSQYPDCSTVEAIYQYVTMEHQGSPIGHLIFGGDVNNIPTAMADDATDPTEPPFASDSYYCMDTKSGQYTPDFSVSRFPASTPGELREQCELAADYSKYYTELRKSAVFTTYNQSNYEQCKDAICVAINHSDIGFTIKKCYDGKCTKQGLINAIESGEGFINYRGHGDVYCWQSSIGLNNFDVSKLAIGHDTPHVLSLACNNNAIHYYPDLCFGSAWIRRLKAVSFLGASAPSYTVVNDCFDQYLWEAIYHDKLTVIGEIFLKATTMLYKNNPSGQTYTNIKEFLLLGDSTADYLEVDSGK
ncbi:MAG: C25 family cysteine peptidase [Acetanaerobacterium sp.]